MEVQREEVEIGPPPLLEHAPPLPRFVVASLFPMEVQRVVEIGSPLRYLGLLRSLFFLQVRCFSCIAVFSKGLLLLAAVFLVSCFWCCVLGENG